MATAAVDVNLGFVEESAPWKLRSKLFPHKVGGFPAWLGLNNLPNRLDMLCKKCFKPMIFLLQVYAPISEIESAFHRTIFLFMCSNGKCCERNDNKNFVVFRNQLSQQNKFYSSKAPDYTKEDASYDPSAEQYQPLCCMCGCLASVKCTECLEAHYCSEFHRVCDGEWNHQSICKKKGIKAGSKRKMTPNQFWLPEYGLTTLLEELQPTEPEKSEEQKMEEYQKYMQSAKEMLQDVHLDYLDDVAIRHDKIFNKFLKRIKMDPEQVLRYQRGGTPLWVSGEHVPSPNDIPDCACGAKRIFEFQVMPQLLNYLTLDSIDDSVDWGTLAVYTCSNSCDKGVENYVTEYVWKQDFSEDNR